MGRMTRDWDPHKPDELAGTSRAVEQLRADLVTAGPVAYPYAVMELRSCAQGAAAFEPRREHAR
jgi:hypothetical protein